MTDNTYSWMKALQRALKRNRREPFSRYFQLASVDDEGVPRVRTVVFRGMAADGESLLLITDGRSSKVEQVKQRAAVEICWYFTISREQFRISGAIACHTPEDDPLGERARVWSGLSAAARAQFFWPTPGAPLEGHPAKTVADEASMPDNFWVLAVRPEQIDHLVLSKQQQRTISTRGAVRWQWNAVNP